jgi:hypothetical protein
MVPVFVCDEDSAQAFRRAADGGEPFPDLAGAEPGIDQEPGFARFEVGAIARAAAAKDGELNRHAATLGKRPAPASR